MLSDGYGEAGLSAAPNRPAFFNFFQRNGLGLFRMRFTSARDELKE